MKIIAGKVLTLILCVSILLCLFATAGYSLTEEEIYEEIYGNLNTANHKIDFTTLQSLIGTHPRLILNADKLNGINSLMGAGNSIMSASYQEAKTRAGWGVNYEIPETITTNAYDSTFSALFEYLPSLALCYIIDKTNNASYLARAVEWAESFCEYPVWEENFPDLGTGFALTSLAFAYDWLYDDLTEPQRTKIKNKLILETEKVYNYIIGEEYARHEANRAWLQNHMWIPVSGMACAGAALYGEATEAEKWLTLVADHLSTAVSLMPEDGVAHEGMDYFFYGMESLFIYADLADQLLGIDIFEADFFQNVSEYLIYSFYPKNHWATGNVYFDLKDSNGGGLKTHIIMLIASKNNDGYAQWLSNLLNEKKIATGHYYFKMLWYDNDVVPKPPSDKPVLKHFNDLDYVVSRSDWSGDESIVYFKSGLPMGHKEYNINKAIDPIERYDFGGAHVHPDNNHFILYGNGEVLLRDDNYTVPKYTAQHNTLTVNGAGQAGDTDRWFDTLEFHEEDGYAKILNASSDGNVDYIVGDASGSYRKSSKVEKFKRHLIFVKPNVLIVLDDVELEESGTMKLRFWPQSQDISKVGQDFFVNGGNSDFRILDLSKNSDESKFELETVWGREVTDERKSISFAKTDSEWVNAVALTWNEKGAAPAKVEYTESEGKHYFMVDNHKIIIDTEAYTARVIESVYKVYNFPGNGGIVFAKAIEASEGQDLVEYGMVFSKKDDNPLIGNADCVKYTATAPKNSNGYYGIQFMGDGITPAITYFAKPYMIYREGGIDKILYGDVIAFTPQSASINSFLQDNGRSYVPVTSYEVTE